MTRYRLFCLIAAGALGAGLSHPPAYAANEPPAVAPDPPAHPPLEKDEVINARVERMLQTIDFPQIRALTTHGIVSLIGTVPSEAARARVARIVASLAGVRGVETSRLAIKAKT